MVEHPVHTRVVICSNQIAATRPVGQAVKTPPFHGGNMGSIPVRVTKKKTHHLVCLFLAICRESKRCNNLSMQQHQAEFCANPKEAAGGDACERRQWRKKRAKRRGSGRNLASVCEQKISGTATGTLPVAPPLPSADSHAVRRARRDGQFPRRTKPVKYKRYAHLALSANLGYAVFGS